MNKIIISILRAAALLRIRHWQTDKYAEHVAVGEAYDLLDEFADTLVEAFQGYDSERMKFEGDEITLLDSDESTAVLTIERLVAYLKNVSWPSPEFKNMSEELVGKLDKILYLLTLK